MGIALAFKSAPFWAAAALLASASWCCGGEEVVAPEAPASPPPQSQAYIKQAPPCPMGWVLPGSAGYSGELPATGEVPFEWTEHPEASSYNIKVTEPNGAEVDYSSDGASKSLFMENYSDAGIYYVEVSALGPSGEFLCAITLTFSKDQVNNDVGGGGDEPPANDNPPAVDQPVNNDPPILIVIPVEPAQDVPK